jgi:uncharacterized protein
MAVKTEYVVLNKKNEEVMRTEEKKYADWYDKRLDVASQVQDLILKVVDKESIEKLTDIQLEELSVALSMHSNKLTKVLKGKGAEDVIKEEGIDSEYKIKDKS